MAQAHGAAAVPTFCPARKWRNPRVYVPLVAGDQARGIINLMDIEREHAFSDADVRLLQTLAATA